MIKTLIKDKTFLSSLVIIGAALFVSSILMVSAASRDDIVYPVAELGGCKNKEDCFSYCDDRNNIERVKTCITFAKKHNLLPQDEIKEAEYYVITLGISSGPGGCQNRAACDAYCENIANLRECLDFAKRYDLRSPEELAAGRKLEAVLNSGTKLPGGCRTKIECEAYCEDPARMKECVAFAEKAGLISTEEAEVAKKIIPVLEQGEKMPGNCGRKAACEAYCKISEHIDECLAFAERTGLMDEQELAEAKRFVPLIKRGETPGKCRGKIECEAYCQAPGHFDECLAFGEKAGLLSKEDVEIAKKTKGTGPGGCRSKTACAEYCRNKANQENCLKFAKEHGLLEEFSGIEQEERAQQEAEGLAKAEEKLRTCAAKTCQEMITCLEKIDKELTKEEGTGENALPQDVKSKLNACIEDIAKEAGKKNLPEGRLYHRETDTPSTPARAETTPASPEEERSLRTREETQRRYETEYQRQYEEQVKQQVNCTLFEAAPTCAYLGAPETQNYQYCKICFPNK